MLRLPERFRLLDPRRSIRARFAWILGVSGLLFALTAASLVERYQRAQLEAGVGQALRREAHLVGQALAAALQDRLALVRQTASNPVLSTGLMEVGDIRSLLEQLRANQPEFAWVALVAPDGKVQVATQALLEGDTLPQEPWLTEGLKGPWMGSRHGAGRLSGPFGLTHGQGTPEFLDLSAPLVDYQGQAIGVLLVEIDWAWVEGMHHGLVTEPDRDAGVDTLLLGPADRVDLGPPALRDQSLSIAGLDLAHVDGNPAVLAWPDGRRYLTVAVKASVAGSGRNFTLVARQDEARAFATAERLRRRLLQGGLLATLVIVGLSVWMAGRVAHPIRQLSAAAGRLRKGEAADMSLPLRGGGDELRELAGALFELNHALREQISERERAAQQYLALFEGSPDAHFVAFDGRVAMVNGGCLRLFGARHIDELTQRSTLSLVHPDCHAQLRERLSMIRNNVSRLPTVEERIIRLDGRCVEVESSALTFREGDRVGVHVVLRDITERKEASRVLAQSEERFRLALRGTSAGVWDWDLPANTVVYSDTWEALLGLPAAAMPVRMRDWSPWLHEEDRERVFQQLRDLGAGQTDLVDTEMRMRHREGREVVLLTRAFLVRGPAGEPQRVIGTVLDVTERHQAREALRQLNAELEQRVEQRTAQLRQANVELDSFAHAVSHDLRAPLRAMSGFSMALQEDYGPVLAGAGRSYLGHIVQSTRHMTELIDGLLTLSRNSRSTMHDGPVNLSALAQRAVDELRRTEPGRVVEVEIATGLSAQGDARMLDVVMRNLIGNAWKYTGHAAAARIRFEAVDRDGQTWYQVSDNGAGFDMKYAGQLFQAFQRLHRQDEFPGIGIGLATVQRIVHRHGGQIEAEAVRDQGASFRFTLPGTALADRPAQAMPKA